MTAQHRKDDPITSIEAAQSVDTLSLDEAILAFLKRKGKVGGTFDEIADGTGIQKVSVSPRLRPMHRKGLVIETPIKRKGHSGRAQIVWSAA